MRTYAVVDNALPDNLCQVASAILPAAKAKGFQVILGLSYVPSQSNRVRASFTCLTSMSTEPTRVQRMTQRRQP